MWFIRRVSFPWKSVGNVCYRLKFLNPPLSLSYEMWFMESPEIVLQTVINHDLASFLLALSVRCQTLHASVFSAISFLRFCKRFKNSLYELWFNLFHVKSLESIRMFSSVFSGKQWKERRKPRRVLITSWSFHAAQTRDQNSRPFRHLESAVHWTSSWDKGWCFSSPQSRCNTLSEWNYRR
jgi:hypothetical protein